MALVNCPECGKSISDKSKNCINCGYPLNEIKSEESEQIQLYTICPACNHKNEPGTFICKNCGHKYTMIEYEVVEERTHHNFNGVYRYTLLGGKQEVYCPRCGSSECLHYKEQKVVPGKTKTSYTMNLNPLKPFTLVNKKEKVVKRESIYTENKFMCNKCGKIFL